MAIPATLTAYGRCLTSLPITEGGPVAYVPREQFLAQLAPAVHGTVVLVQDEQGRVLLLRDSPDPAREADGAQRRWLPPGGHLEPGEPPKKGGQRELWEETGLKRELRTLGTDFVPGSPTWPNTTDHLFTAGQLTAEEAAAIRLSSEHDEARFVPPEELGALLGVPTRHARLLSMLRAAQDGTTVTLLLGEPM